MNKNKPLSSKKVKYSILLESAYKENLLLICNEENPDPYLVAMKTWPKSYFCNLTAVFYHKLTNQVPASIYIALEVVGRRNDQPQYRKKVSLTDHAIFQAFMKEHRITRNSFGYGDFKIIVTERMDRNRMGIVEVNKDLFLPQEASITDLERTMIDCIINPHYNGGITNVINYFKTAKERINGKHLITLYKELDYLYPYWQSIGFICDKVGALDIAARIQSEFQLKNKFYIDHLAKTSWLYDEKWKLYYPPGLI